MPTPKLSDAECQSAVNAVARYGSKMQASQQTGINRLTLNHRLRVAESRGIRATQFAVKVPISETLPVEAIRERRKEQFAHLKQAKAERILTPINVTIDGPIGIVHFGDPHLDDDGTDLERIEEHTNIVRRTPGLFAANIGDGINAWTGRLARLYGEQSTSESEAIALYEWWLGQLAPHMLYCIGGNHLAWHNGMGMALHRWILANCGTLFDQSSVRFDMRFPNSKSVRVNARHDFAGHSMWNTVHGALKAATMGWRDHILTCGHIHTSGYAVLKDPATGLITHALRVSSYKTFDRYAHEKGLPNQDIFPAVVTIIDPTREDNDPRLIHTCFDVESGADYLTWLRKRK